MDYIVDMEEVIKNFENKYGKDDVYTEKFRDKFAKWITNFKTDEEKKIFLKLMKEYEYFNRKWFKEAFLKLYKQCLSQGIKLENSKILSMSKDNEADSSIEYFGLLRELDRSENLGFYSDTLIRDIKGIKDAENVLFFDDISGSGGTVKKYLTRNSEYLKGKNVFVNVCIITSKALEDLTKYCKTEKSFKIIINYYELKNKSIDDNSIICINEKNSILRIEESLWGKGNNQILGYKDSQLLITFFHNTPNNTISSFWFSESFYNQAYKNFYGEKKWNELFGRYRPPKRKLQNMLKKRGDSI